VRYYCSMASSKSGTVRLDQLIKSSGKPEAITLWTRPEDNPEFMRAVKQHRVMTVIQRNVGTKKDYGLVGFFPKELAAFWIFPKPLDFPNETKVIGINYDRLATSEPRGTLYKPKPKRRYPGIPLRKERTSPAASKIESNSAPAKPKTPPPPKQFAFRGRARITATQDLDLEAKASSAAEASSHLKAQVEQLAIDPAKAKISRKFSRPTKSS
jgi:hypothetical protein